MSVYQFGAGVLIATPNAGNLAANPTPMQFGTLQEVSLEISGEIKELFGRNQFADDVRRGKMKITGKAKFGRFNGKLVNDLFFGQTISVGTMKVVLDEEIAVPGVATYTVTVSGAANFGENLGVRYSATGETLTKVDAGSEAAGKYSVDTATGIYTFAAADKSVKMLFTYTKKDAVNGLTTNVKSKLMGFQPKFALILNQPTDGNESNVKLYRCIAAKLTRPTKNDDYTVPEFDFESFADDAGNVIDFYDAQ